jgi:hypothetical protein
MPGWPHDRLCCDQALVKIPISCVVKGLEIPQKSHRNLTETPQKTLTKDRLGRITAPTWAAFAPPELFYVRDRLFGILIAIGAVGAQDRRKWAD